VTEFVGTSINFLPVDESHTHALSRHQALETWWPGVLDTVKPQSSINKAACGTELILTADLAYLVSCAILCHLLMSFVFECLV